MARTGTGHILGDETDSVGALSGGLATKTDSVGVPASGGIATETDIMGRPALGRSLYTEYTVYRYTHILIGLPVREIVLAAGAKQNRNCLNWCLYRSVTVGPSGTH